VERAHSPQGWESVPEAARLASQRQARRRCGDGYPCRGCRCRQNDHGIGYATVVLMTPTAGFLSALLSVPAAAWQAWFSSDPAASPDAESPRELLATFALPHAKGEAAICLFEIADGPQRGALEQLVLQRWFGESPADARPLYAKPDGNGAIEWTLATAWADPAARAWFRAALSAGALLRSEEWEWHALPERAAALRNGDGDSLVIPERRHDVITYQPGAVAVSYRRLTRGAQPELDILRHLSMVPGVRVAPTVLGSAIVRSPSGEKSASAVLQDLVPDAVTARTVVVNRLRRALDGDPSEQAAALDDVRAAGTVLRELHGALGRPIDQGVLQGAQPATEIDVDAWIARVWETTDTARGRLQRSRNAEATLLEALVQLPARVQQFGAAAKRAPGLQHRIHGDFRLENLIMSPQRRLSIVEFNGDARIPDAERVRPHSPWRDVAQLLFSVADAAAAGAQAAGGDAHALEIAWLWEREARRACLEGYGPGGGAALHALIAVFEIEFAARQLSASVGTGQSTALLAAAHTLRRLNRTVV
jgi:predicted trehalose synthase